MPCSDRSRRARGSVVVVIGASSSARCPSLCTPGARARRRPSYGNRPCGRGVCTGVRGLGPALLLLAAVFALPGCGGGEESGAGSGGIDVTLADFSIDPATIEV